MTEEIPTLRWRDSLWRRRDLSNEMSTSSDAAATWFDRIHRVAAAVGLVVMIVVLFASGESLQNRLMAWAVAVCLAFLMWWCFYHRGQWFFETRWAAFAYLAVALPLVVWLGVLQSPLQLFLFLAYWQVFSLLPLGWAVIVATVLTLAQGWAARGFGWKSPIASEEGWALAAGVMVVSAVMAGFITSIIGQSDQRQRLLIDLEATREQLASSERTAGVMQERQRLAGEVHDTIAQDLTSIVMHLETAELALAAAHPARDSILAARSAARTGLGEARRMVHALLPEVLGNITLDSALATHVARWSRESNIPASFRVDGSPIALPRNLDVTFFRALQESLANVHRHAHASQVEVTMSYLNDEAILDVGDDGAGIDASAISAGVGLQAMRTRVEQWNGQVAIESEPGEGTVVSVSIPVPEKGQAV